MIQETLGKAVRDIPGITATDARVFPSMAEPDYVLEARCNLHEARVAGDPDAIRAAGRQLLVEEKRSIGNKTLTTNNKHFENVRQKHSKIYRIPPKKVFKTQVLEEKTTQV